MIISNFQISMPARCLLWFNFNKHAACVPVWSDMIRLRRLRSLLFSKFYWLISTCPVCTTREGMALAFLQITWRKVMLMIKMIKVTLLQRVPCARTELCRPFIDINHMLHAISETKAQRRKHISVAKVACTESHLVCICTECSGPMFQDQS
jgi:hypothetical protein